jgi:hypothetical protein
MRMGVLRTSENYEKSIVETIESSAQLPISASRSGLRNWAGVGNEETGSLVCSVGSGVLTLISVPWCAERECACAFKRFRFQAIGSGFRWIELA